MNILGLSCFYHDSAAALVRDGVIVAAAQEERFTRRRHDERFPVSAVRFCLERSGISMEQVDLVVFYDKPLLKFERLLHSYLSAAPYGLRSFAAAIPAWMKDKLWMKELIRESLDYRGEILFTEHHESHAASAFYPSPFKEAAVLTMDGVGEWATASVGRGDGHRLDLLSELKFPHSLGLLYSAFTHYCGFRVNSGEYKLMGLAPLGEPRYESVIRDTLLDLKEDGSFRLDLSYFDFVAGLTMTNAKFDALFAGPARAPEAPLERRHKDLAASVQAVCEEVMLRMARRARAKTGSSNLCLAGGVALNCVGNGRIVREGVFDNVWIQPAAGDAGGALGAALFAWHAVLGKPRDPGPRDGQQGSLLGPDYSDEAIEAALKAKGAAYRRLEPAALHKEVAGLLAQGKVVGWFQGRMEYGPRALGARSILADARDAEMRSTLNLKIKGRESFRPFAPAVLAEKAAEWFDLGVASPYMMLTAPARNRSALPATTHVDGSARVQTVAREDNAPFYDLLAAFETETGCPALANTSFNVRGEPIVCRPEEAWACFRRTGMDSLAIGSFLLFKDDQPPLTGDEQWTTFAPD
ncbi:MAG: carbamoyltransferase [Elusimicrobiota bacterium]|nr:MAG: carbamoyltransferase [Elusimicrobiota bacterium]